MCRQEKEGGKNRVNVGLADLGCGPYCFGFPWSVYYEFVLTATAFKLSPPSGYVLNFFRGF